MFAWGRKLPTKTDRFPPFPVTPSSLLNPLPLTLSKKPLALMLQLYMTMSRNRGRAMGDGGLTSNRRRQYVCSRPVDGYVQTLSPVKGHEESKSICLDRQATIAAPTSTEELFWTSTDC